MSPLLRKFPEIRDADIILYGHNKIHYNTVLDILLSFQRLNSLELINIVCTKMLSRVLGGITYKRIILKDIYMRPFCEE